MPQLLFSITEELGIMQFLLAQMFRYSTNHEVSGATEIVGVMTASQGPQSFQGPEEAPQVFNGPVFLSCLSCLIWSAS